MEMTPETIKALLDAFDGSDWREMVVTVGEDRLHVSRDPLPEAAVHPPRPRRPPPRRLPRLGGARRQPGPSGGGAGRGPGARRRGARRAGRRSSHRPSASSGAHRRPGAAPFVEVGGPRRRRRDGGDRRGDEADEPRRLAGRRGGGAILVENGAPVEFGQPIVVVDPEG